MSEGGPQRLGRYVLQQTLGAGGMGVVYLAEDTQLRRRVALKVIQPRLMSDPSLRDRFLREGRTASSLQHPNVAAIYESGEGEDGTAFLAMEYVSGETLAQVLSRRKLSIEEILETAMAISDALDEARRLRIVHRDLKPGNVMLDSFGRVKVLDFGLAKLFAVEEEASSSTAVQPTRPGLVVGTSGYMSPEQAAGLPLDHRSDLYSLGVVMYEMISSRRPSASPERLTSFRSDCPKELERIVMQCLQREPERRYQTARDLLLDLQSLSAHLKKPSLARPVWIALALLLVLITAALAYALVSRRSAQPPPAAPVRALVSSVAVLPFVNLSGSVEDEYFADGVTEEITHALARVPRLKVVSRTSAFAFKGVKADVREIGGKLGVESIVEGSVRRTADRLRITAQLVKAADGYHLWANTFDRRAGDIFAVQNEIARAVARALQGESAGVAPLIRTGTSDPEAYDLYLQGRQFSTVWESRSLQRAIDSYHRALTRDPNMALAHAGLAEVYSLVDHATGPRLFEDEEAYARSIAAANRALQLDPHSDAAQAALGHIYLHKGYFQESRRHLERALQLNPNSAAAHQWMGVLLDDINQDEDAAIRYLGKARELDPLSGQAHLLYIGAFLSSGRYEEALEAAKQGVEAVPDHPTLRLYLVRSQTLLGRFPEAASALDQIAQGPPQRLAQERAILLALSGRPEEARSIMERLTSSREYVPERDSATAWASIGDLERSIEALQRLCRERPNYARLNLDFPPHPAFQTLSNDPRLAEMRRQLGLPPGYRGQAQSTPRSRIE